MLFYLNTTHVSVQYTRNLFFIEFFMYLNTTHVSVQFSANGKMYLSGG